MRNCGSGGWYTCLIVWGIFAMKEQGLHSCEFKQKQVLHVCAKRKLIHYLLLGSKTSRGKVTNGMFNAQCTEHSGRTTAQPDPKEGTLRNIDTKQLWSSILQR